MTTLTEEVMIRLPQSLKDLFSRWDSVDDELREHYVYDLVWALQVFNDLLVYECTEDLRLAAAELLTMDGETFIIMGVRPSDYLDGFVAR